MRRLGFCANDLLIPECRREVQRMLEKDQGTLATHLLVARLDVNEANALDRVRFILNLDLVPLDETEAFSATRSCETDLPDPGFVNRGEKWKEILKSTKGIVGSR